MLRSLLLVVVVVVAALLAVNSVDAVPIKSMVASQRSAKMGLRDKDLLTYVNNVPDNIRDMMLRMRFRR
ncbi:hypothetical protein OESDEN_18708 [Oesophagostomum dentatum]|uniref:Uncharacterized protein n=1 Tax=Oesophagostomum dentatum TaxID=61180 RepID=A0A0B1S9L5_OESDE|nr:hypothetical protein OESDEN_18708 [Oesophagostomum dentatum]